MNQQTEERNMKAGRWLRLSCVLFLFSVLCPLSSQAASQTTSPGSVQLAYDIYKGGLKIGLIEETYTRDKDHYSLVSTTSAVGLLAIFMPGKIVISSRGLIGKKGLQPLFFSDLRRGKESEERRAEFDWESGKLILTHQEQREIVSLPTGTQDRLSAMYQFMFLPLQTGYSMEFPMVNMSKLDKQHYTVLEPRSLKTPAGDFLTLYLDNRPKPGEKKIEMWLATQQYNLPCKMVITEADGGQLTQILNKLDAKP
jgi:hypothetical protein